MQNTSVMDSLPPQQITTDVLLEKYCKGDETNADQIYRRVAKHLASVEATEELKQKWEELFYNNMKDGAIGAGRIMSAAGTDLKATLLNCYVVAVGDSIDGYDEDGVPGIYEALRQAACTMQKGGGVGYNFSKIRPRGAWVKSVNSDASGPCSYMDIFDSSCKTIESAGNRRGAMLGAINIDHPDVFEFISAKRVPGRWNNFNVSVVVTDKFMKAKNNWETWDLVHKATPSQKQIAAGAHQREDGMWVYRTVSATELWDAIMRSNYEYAEPGILFYDNINNDNNLWYVETLECTNPCVTGDTLVLTITGYIPIKDLVDKQVKLWNGFEWSKVTPMMTGQNQEIFDIEFNDGTTLSCTPYHKFILADNTRVMAKDLTPDQKLSKFTLPIIDGYIKLDSKQAYTQGFYTGDGTTGKNCIYLYDKKAMLRDELLANGFKDCSFGKTTKIRANLLFKPDPKDFVPGADHSVKSRLAWLAGLIDSDGSVSDKSVTIWSIDKNFLMKTKLMLAATGCFSSVLAGKPAQSKSMPDGRGGYKDYQSKECYRLTIPGSSIYLLKLLGLKTKRVNLEGAVSREARRFVLMKTKVKRNTLEEKVYCFTDPLNNSGLFNGLMTGNCGEVPLPPDGCCDLGPIILPKLVKNAFTPNAKFDYGKLAEMVKIQTRMLDNVLDASVWPLEQQQKEAMHKRRIGVGFTGLANALAMLNVVYYSDTGLKTADAICDTMKTAAYEASAMIAAEKGSFPAFDADKFLKDGTAASRLPVRVKNLIRKYGIRNSHLLSIAPTGTVSLAFADNASNGIEPPYSLAYTRKKRTGDGHVMYNVLDHSLRVYLNQMHDQDTAKELENAVCNHQPTFEHFGTILDTRACLPKSLVTALEMTTDQHLAMMKVVQPYICQSISKTVNVPKDASFEEFKTIYDHAWDYKLKGVSTYRPNDILGSVLSVEAPKKEEKKEPPKVKTVDANKVREVVDRLYSQPFTGRSDGVLTGLSTKGRFYTEHGEQKFIITINFTDSVHTEPGLGTVKISRPTEFLLVSNFQTSSSVWQASMRFMSLMARSGVPIPKIIENMKEVTWEHGKVRFGTREKDGRQIPLWHDSDVAAIGHAIQQALINVGYLTQEGELDKPYSLMIDGQSAQLIGIEEVQETVTTEHKEPVPTSVKGKTCPECGADALAKRDGCETCSECGYVGSCG